MKLYMSKKQWVWIPVLCLVVGVVLGATISNQAGKFLRAWNLPSALSPQSPTSQPPRGEWTAPKTETVTAINGERVLVYTDVPYGQDDPRQALDIYRPAEAVPVLPVIVFIHGGWFEKGDKRLTNPLPYADMATLGYVVVSINYRLFDPQTGENPLPTQIYDTKGALRFLRANAETYGLDARKIAVMGYSAGGFLASHIGTTGGVAEFEGEVGGNLEYAGPVQAVVVVAGSFTLSSIDDFGTEPMQKLMTLLGCDPATPSCADTLTEGVPETYADATDPPFLLVHGETDPTVPIAGARGFQAALTGAGVQSTLKIAPDIGHQKNPLLARFDDDLAAFFATHLR